MKNTIDIKNRIAQHQKEIAGIEGKDWAEVHIHKRIIEELRWVIA